MTYNEKKEITWYLERNGYESHNGIKYIKKYHGGDTVVSVTVLAVGNKEYCVSAVCRTVLRLTGGIGGSVELTRSVESLGDIIAIETNIGSQRDFMFKVINNKMYNYETDKIPSQEKGHG